MSTVQVQNQLDALNNHNQTQDARINTFEGQVNTLDAKFTNVERKVNETDQLALAIDSKQKALEQQFNEAIEGEVQVSNAEVIEARGLFPRLATRLNASDSKVNGIEEELVAHESSLEQLPILDNRIADYEQSKDSFITLADFDNNKVPNGWCKLPNGIIMMWGRTTIQTTGAGYHSHATDLPFVAPNGVAAVTCSVNTVDGTQSNYRFQVDARAYVNQARTSINITLNSAISATPWVDVYWSVIGY